MLEIITPKTSEQIECVRRLFGEYERSLPFDHGVKDIQQELTMLPEPYTTPAGCLLLATWKGEPAGCVALRHHEGNTCEMRRLFVRSEYRGRGIGRILCTEAIQRAEQVSYKRIILATVLEPAKSLYQSLDFTPIAPYKQVSVEGVVFMERLLMKGSTPMTDAFPEPIQSLPLADVPLEGCTAHLSQSDTHQILFMQFDRDVDLPEHSHAAQWGVVLEGTIEMTIGGVTRTFTKGDRPYIPAGVRHAARIHAGYADISFFDQKDRYKVKL